ncbi:MAG: hypothetical protein MUC29_01535 [Pyrinomonadaceae bacterium]|jgi:hypothetical protein|nr:hypothetical protein [Pyrinomonadaceae bacterium]
MDIEINSENPVVKAIIAGNAPRPAQIAASRGMLPLSQADLLEVLVFLARSNDAELAQNSQNTINSQDLGDLKTVVESTEVSPNLLGYLAEQTHFPKEIHESVVQNDKTPIESIIDLATNTTDGNLIELISVNQQRLIQFPQLIDAILANPSRTSNADRRASETKKEFFEKERGAEQIANELRAKGNDAAAEFIEQSEFVENLADSPAEGKLSVEDAILLASHIEVSDSEIDDSWLSLEFIEEIYEETEEQRLANFKKVVGELAAEDDEVSNERVSFIKKVLTMTVKDRVKAAMKGDREVRNILIRDSNRIVCQAVVQNPKITEQEIEKISAMRSVTEDVLRFIANNRNFARNYSIIHNLARNARTPIANVMGILPRLQTRDLVALSKNRNVSDAVRRQGLRLSQARAGR